MKIEEVKKLSPLDRFTYWIRERHQIYLRRKAGKPKPWTDDEVLQTTFFTNPYRENDKVTVWFRENIREPLRSQPEVLMATVIFRWFNLPEPTGLVLMSPRCKRENSETHKKIVPVPGHEELGMCEKCRAAEIELEQFTCEEYLREDGKTYDLLRLLKSNLVDWNPAEVLSLLGRIRERKQPVFTGAFMINSPGGEPKLEAIIRRISKVWSDRERILHCLTTDEFSTGSKCSMETAHGVLTQYEGLGGFMAYEIVCDLRYTYLLEHAGDKMTWCNPGPGCSRGLHRVLGLDFPKGKNSSSPTLPKGWRDHMVRLLDWVQNRLPKMPSFEMREIEHSLCEFDKYERVLWGDGRAKRTYNGTN